MKIKLESLTTVLAAGILTLGNTLIVNQPAHSQNSTFFCGESGGVPATLASTPRGNVVVIRWVSKYFNQAGYNPQQRCEEVSSRFQTYKNNGSLSYITTGRMNSQNVVCVSSSNGGPCSGLLFTLKPRENASRVVQQLFDIRAGAAGPLNESTERVYIDVEQMLNSRPVEGGSSNSAPENVPANPTQPNSNPGGSVW